MLELRPRVRTRLRDARLDDARAEALEIRDPGLRGVARLDLAAVADARRLPQQAYREPVEPPALAPGAPRAPTT